MLTFCWDRIWSARGKQVRTGWFSGLLFRADKAYSVRVVDS